MLWRWYYVFIAVATYDIFGDFILKRKGCNFSMYLVKMVILKAYIKLKINFLIRTSNLWVCVVFLIGFLPSACNITYRVRNQYDGIDHILHMPCGKVTLELVGKGNSKFVLKHRFDLDSEVVVFTDSLQIRYNGRLVLPAFNTESKNGPNVEIDNLFDLQAFFELEEGVFDGDTIIVYADSYLDCNQQKISLDTLEFRFLNNFRIRGINYPDDGFNGKGTLQPTNSYY